MRHARKAQGRRIPHILLITVLVVMICVGSVVTVMANTVEITVRDDGIGIAPDQQARVWQRFYQVDPVRGEKSGAGLGLSMVWKIAQAHGGHMSLESVPGQGSSFTLHLPAER